MSDQPLAHGAFLQLESNLWTVEGAIPLLPFQRRMTVVRTDLGLFVHSAIRMRDPQMAELDALGPVRVVIVPNRYHRLDAPYYKARYPDARVFCPRQARSAVGQKVHLDGDYSLIPAMSGLDWELLDGVSIGEAVFRITSDEGRITLLFNDILFNHRHVDGVRGQIFKLIGSTGGPRVTKVMRYSSVGDRRALGSHLERLADMRGLHRVIPGHGDVIEGEQASRAALRTAAASIAR